MQFLNWIVEFQTLIVGIIGFAGVAATLWYNGKLARQQRWWELKIEAYARVIEALHNSKAFSEEYLEADIKGKNLSDNENEELRKRAKLGHNEIVKVIDTGTFLISKNALTRLQQFRKEEDQASGAVPWIEYLEANWKATDGCLEDIIKIAKAELRMK